MCIGLPPVANLPATTLWVCSRALFPPPGSLRLIHLQPDFPCPAVAHSCPIAWPASPVFRRVCSPSARRVVYFPRDDCLRACPQAGIPQRRERACAFRPALRGSSLRALRAPAWARLGSVPAVARAAGLLSFSMTAVGGPSLITVLFTILVLVMTVVLLMIVVLFTTTVAGRMGSRNRRCSTKTYARGAMRDWLNPT